MLDREDVAEIVARFATDRLLYEIVTSEVHRRVVNLLQNRALKSVVTSRAKSVESLTRTLWRDREKWTALEFVSLSPPLMDLAGVRVLLYRAEDVEPSKDAIVREFEILKEKDKRSPEGYSAYHVLAHNWCAAADPNHSHIRHIPCEIQICSILEHVWNELEHDIIYKQPGGSPDERQRELLVSLRAELDLASRTSNRLMKRTDERTRENNEPLNGSQELRRYLENRLNRRIDGAFDDLFALLGQLLDNITPKSMDDLFGQGREMALAAKVQSRMDPDGSHQEIGLVGCMLIPALSSANVLDVIGESPRQPFLKFMRRVAMDEAAQ